MSTIWKPLEEPYQSTRVFELLPGSQESKICIRLHHILLGDDSLQFEAISYTWGDETASVSIEIDGKDYEIRRNLHQFIHILRRPHESRYLWADAICIDQTNLKEKSEQVSVIGQIFRQATVVRVWLGPHRDGSEQVMNVIAREPSHSTQVYYVLPRSGRKMALDLRRLKQLRDALKFTAIYPLRALGQPKAADAFPEMSVRHGWWLLTQREREEFAQHRSQLVALMNRGYWFRTWIVQEILLAQQVVVHCGSSTATWESMGTLFSRVAAEQSHPVLALSKEQILNGKQMLFNQLYGERLETLVASCKTTECFDPRDRIYALLSLAFQGTAKLRLSVDYNEPAVDLLFRAIKFCQDQFLEDIQHSSGGEGYNGDAHWRPTMAAALGLSSADVKEALRARPTVPKELGIDEESFVERLQRVERRYKLDRALQPRLRRAGAETIDIDWKAGRHYRKRYEDLSGRQKRVFLDLIILSNEPLLPGFTKYDKLWYDRIPPKSELVAHADDA